MDCLHRPHRPKRGELRIVTISMLWPDTGCGLNSRALCGALLLAALCAAPLACLADASLTPAEIVRRAHVAAGADIWVRPTSLYLSGSATFYEGTSQKIFDRHEMWRVYPKVKVSAHQADGKVRIRSSRKGRVALDLAFDGQRTFVNGVVSDDSGESRRWASNFGFGVIRHALDAGYSLQRLADDLVDGTPTFTIQVTDPTGTTTLFGISRADYAILMVGFDTPRGWHQRIYSDFFSKPGVAWSQPGRVRLYYDGVKQNEVRWTDFAVNRPIDPEVFLFPVAESAD